MIGTLIPAIAPILSKVIGAVFPDKKESEKVQAELMKQLLMHQNELDKSASDIIQAEASSKHWLAANWRPLTMLFFVFLLGARWFGFSSPSITEEEYLKFLDLVQYGLTGYIAGRTAEKILPGIIQNTFKRKNRNAD